MEIFRGVEEGIAYEQEDRNKHAEEYPEETPGGKLHRLHGFRRAYAHEIKGARENLLRTLDQHQPGL